MRPGQQGGDATCWTAGWGAPGGRAGRLMKMVERQVEGATQTMKVVDMGAAQHSSPGALPCNHVLRPDAVPAPCYACPAAPLTAYIVRSLALSTPPPGASAAAAVPLLLLPLLLPLPAPALLPSSSGEAPAA